MKKILGTWTLEAVKGLTIAVRVNAVGLFCPVPIAKTGEALRRLKPGEVLKLEADDPGVVLDLAAWCKSMRQELLAIFLDDRRVYHCYVRKTARRTAA